MLIVSKAGPDPPGFAMTVVPPEFKACEAVTANEDVPSRAPENDPLNDPLMLYGPVANCPGFIIGMSMYQIFLFLQLHQIQQL